MKGEIVQRVVEYIAREIVEDSDAVSVTIVEDGPDEVTAEVRAAKPDMGRVIGRRGRAVKEATGRSEPWMSEMMAKS